MKAPKADVSVVGRLGASGKAVHRTNYGVGRLGISGTDSGQCEEQPAAEPVAVTPNPPTGGTLVAPPVPVSAPARDVPTVKAPTGETLVAPPRVRQPRKVLRLIVVGAVTAGLACAYGVYHLRKSAGVPAPVAASPSAQAPAVRLAPRVTPSVKPLPAGRTNWLIPTVRGYVASATAAFYNTRGQVREFLAAIPRTSDPSARTPKAAPPRIEIASAQPASQPSPASNPASAPAIRYRDCPAGFALSSVINTPDGAFAGINGKMCKVGGVVNNATLVAIRDYSVEMELAGERFIVGIGEEAARVRSSDEGQADEETPATKPAKKSTGNPKPKRPAVEPAEDEESPAEGADGQ